MNDERYYNWVNKEQPVKHYSREEIRAYAKTKPKTFFSTKRYLVAELEKWLDIYVPKTGVDEVKEIRLAMKALKARKGKYF